MNKAKELYWEISPWFQNLELPERVVLAEELIDLLEELKDEWITEQTESFCMCDPDCGCHV